MLKINIFINSNETSSSHLCVPTRFSHLIPLTDLLVIPQLPPSINYLWPLSTFWTLCLFTPLSKPCLYDYESTNPTKFLIVKVEFQPQSIFWCLQMLVNFALLHFLVLFILYYYTIYIYKFIVGVGDNSTPAKPLSHWTKKHLAFVFLEKGHNLHSLPAQVTLQYPKSAPSFF